MCALPLRRVRVLFEIFSVESEKKSLKYCGLLWPRTIREVVNVVANKTGWRATRTSAFYYLTINVTLSCVFYETPSTPPPPPLPPHVSLAFCLFYRFFFCFSTTNTCTSLSPPRIRRRREQITREHVHPLRRRPPLLYLVLKHVYIVYI